MHAPHKSVEAKNARERFLVSLLDALWERYRGRVEWVRRYEELLARHGARFLNDHVAFRSIAWDEPAAGLFSVARLFEALGYRAAGAYAFPDQKLSAVHFAPPNPALPKLFVSELKAWELSPASRRIVEKSLKARRAGLSREDLAALAGLRGPDAALLRRTLAHFSSPPWPLPERRDVEALDKESQYAAWVLLNGYEVNHFTASVDAHGVAALGDIDRTVAAMRSAGIPMKDEIEGAPGTKLRQSATRSAVIEVPVRVGRRKTTMPWTYAYFEIAERPLLPDPSTGERRRFEGFLGPQASQLFEMTRLKSPAPRT